MKSQKIMKPKKTMKTKETMKSNKITLAILFSLSCLLLLFAAANSLQAQQERQQGWSIGVSPFYLGAKIKTTTENTTLTGVGTTVTRTFVTADIEFSASTTDNVPSDATAGAEFLGLNGVLLYGSNYDTIAIDAVVDICEDGYYDGAGTYNAITTEGPATVTTCFNHFQDIAASFSDLTGTVVNSSNTSVSISNENTSLAGNGLQLGYGFEKFRLSFSLHQWSSGDDKMNSQIVLLDYFLPYGLYAGAGLAQTKLDTRIGSASEVAPAIHFGYRHSFTSSFSIEAGLLWLGTSLSIKQSAAAPEPPATLPSPITSSALIEGYIVNTDNSEVYFFDNRIGVASSPTSTDRRILIEGIVTPTYTGEQQETLTPITVPTKTTIEVEAPASLFIRFIYRFR